jgi:hypothetical protein
MRMNLRNALPGRLTGLGVLALCCCGYVFLHLARADTVAQPEAAPLTNVIQHHALQIRPDEDQEHQVHHGGDACSLPRWPR